MSTPARTTATPGARARTASGRLLPGARTLSQARELLLPACRHEGPHLGCPGERSVRTAPAFTRADPPMSATRRQFLLGAVGAAAATAVLGVAAAPAGAQATEGASTGEGSDDGGTADTGTAETGTEQAATEPAAGDRRTQELWLPAYLSRSAWGAEEAWRLGEDGTSSWPVVFSAIQKITVHHTATWTPGTSELATGLVQDIYREHSVDLAFGDIGYHLLIDREGVVYEGRYSGGTRFPVYDIRPGGDPPSAVVAAHTKGYNVGNVGIALIGDLDAFTITDAAWWALVTTIALLCVNADLDPEGTSTYVNPVNGFSIDVPNIGGHRHYAGTACPGEAMMGWMGDLRREVVTAAAGLPRKAWLA